jgi:hypothetical protein
MGKNEGNRVPIAITRKAALHPPHWQRNHPPISSLTHSQQRQTSVTDTAQHGSFGHGRSGRGATDDDRQALCGSGETKLSK